MFVSPKGSLNAYTNVASVGIQRSQSTSWKNLVVHEQDADLPWESRVRAEAAGGFVSEPVLIFSGERLSPFSFFTQFPNIILRLHGSVLPYIVFEVLFAVGLSITALLLQGGYSWSLDEENWSHLGHQFVGMLLAFLTVFRTQSAFSMFSESEVQFNNLLNALRNSAVEIRSQA